MSLSTENPGIETNLPIAQHGGGLSGRIEALLARRILSGELSPGSTLPSQDELVRQFGVSRAVVREAVAALAQRGLLVVHHGRSTLVTDPTLWNVLDPFLVDIFAELGTLKKLLQDLFAVRLLIEPEAAAMVAMDHSPEQLAAIAEPVQRLDQLRQSGPRPAVITADRDFHWQLTLAAGNQVLTSIVRDLQSLLWTQFGISAFTQLERVHSQHRAIYTAIEARDTDAAREATRVHLIDARDRFFGHFPS